MHYGHRRWVSAEYENFRWVWIRGRAYRIHPHMLQSLSMNLEIANGLNHASFMSEIVQLAPSNPNMTSLSVRNPELSITHWLVMSCFGFICLSLSNMFFKKLISEPFSEIVRLVYEKPAPSPYVLRLKKNFFTSRLLKLRIHHEVACNIAHNYINNHWRSYNLWLHES